jgi:hypothetical protein
MSSLLPPKKYLLAFFAWIEKGLAKFSSKL